MLPTFLGIGTSRSGTTWLHEILSAHPDIFVPSRRKEVHFFDWNYERGLAWYEAFFPDSSSPCLYKAVGEITPNYFYNETCARRIAALPSVPKLLLLLRHPVDRLYSSYHWFKRHHNYKGPFQACLAEHPELADRSMYAKYLRVYLNYFDLSTMLILIFEDAILDRNRTLQSLCTFLGVSPDAMPADAGAKASNPATAVRFPFLFHLGSRLSRALRNRDLDRIANASFSVRIRNLLLKDSRPPRLDAELRAKLTETYAEDIRDLESILGMTIAAWKT